ncbi:hypothetical protein GCM10011312_09560 [Planktosalinus lacus]|uniref:DUF1573 domain-containing protein n=2 Tax=Planktosalinus lacus TaxID=1526573 RepID=A0A8J2V9F4_9FLAO|nr:hypothetical protein GCM10011312_09560 [Planktosalinus lacus]
MYTLAILKNLEIMKKLVLILAVGLISFATQAQAKITFDEDTIDYGEIEKGSDGVRTFKFTNTGDQPLVIEDVKSTCGCTIPKKPSDPIAPGASDVIEVKYDTKRVGPIRRSISVYSNADEPIVTLKIKGTVKG